MSQKRTGTAVVLFSRNLRIRNNAALDAACEYQNVLPIFGYDSQRGDLGVDVGEAGRWWLHHSLLQLKSALNKQGSDLYTLDVSDIQRVRSFFIKSDVRAICWSQTEHAGDSRIIGAMKHLSKLINVRYEPVDEHYILKINGLLKSDGSPYQVFTPFWNRFKEMYRPDGFSRLASVRGLPAGIKKADVRDLAIDSVGLISEIRWEDKFRRYWTPGEADAIVRFEGFLDASIRDYDTKRNIPGEKATSRLSPSLHFGEINSGWVLSRICESFGPLQDLRNPGIESFCKELVWREFARSLYTQFPKLETRAIRTKFQRFPWRQNSSRFKVWSRGMTGYPVVDAGMRELWQTGWMHNRVRMVVASFLIKHLNIPWQKGLEWFQSTLLDADRPNNAVGWQWVAGCGADAAPFFRIFNPVLQGEKFDASGVYVRRWCPELAGLPDRWIHKPWLAPEKVLSLAGVRPGVTYPTPVVDHGKSRMQALENYRNL